MSKTRVLLLGATGQTGSSIVDALLEDSEFEVSAFVRPSSAEKQNVLDIKKRGVKIIVSEVDAPHEDLVALLRGIDVFISTIDATVVLHEIKLATAAKEAGVKRFIPCSWATTTPPGGVMAIRDTREKVFQHIKKIFLPYTIIDVGFWYQTSFPTLPSGRVDYASLRPSYTDLNAGGEAPNLLTDNRDVGRFVARIIKDDRTLNSYIFTYGDVLSENDIFGLMEEMSGEQIERTYVTEEQLLDDLVKAQKEEEIDPENKWAQVRVLVAEYSISKYVRRDNCPEYAKYLGYLDARELYPYFQPISFRGFLGELLAGKIIPPYSSNPNVSKAYE